MKTQSIILLALTVCLYAVQVADAQENADLGLRDVLGLTLTHPPEAKTNNGHFLLTLYVRNDANLLRSVSVGFKWDNQSVYLDSAMASPEAVKAFNFRQWLLRKNSLDTTNKYRQFMFAGASYADAGLGPSIDPTPLAYYYFSSKDWRETDQVAVDTATFSAGTTFVFFYEDLKRSTPGWGGRLSVYDANRPCCLSYRGNVDGDPSGVVDISDFTYLLAHLFTVAAPTYPCPEAANVDGSSDGKVDLNDVQALVDFLYGSMTPPAPCPE